MRNKNNNAIDTVKGSGGGAPATHTPTEAPNTLQTITTARVLFLTSRGEVGGLYDQANPLKSVYFNGTPVQSADGSFNFASSSNTAAVAISERFGLPDQEIMDGYRSASNSVNIGTKVTTTGPHTYTTSVDNIDALVITVRFPSLFEVTTTGDTKGSTVSFSFFTGPAGGSLSLAKSVFVTDKTTSASDVDYYIPRPTGVTGTWSIKMVRNTPDNSSTSKANETYFQMATEVQLAKLPYNGFAYIGLTVNAQTTGSTFPTVSFDMLGLKIKVPSNYNVTTRAYSGTWDGTFATERQVCDNPAWIVYDLLTNVEYGMGTLIDPNNIDTYSFYDAAVYNDGMVPNSTNTGLEPRYTLNYQIMDQHDSWTAIQALASTMSAVVLTAGQFVKLVQDRPTEATWRLSNSNVIEDEGTHVKFTYASSMGQTRVTACMVYWNDPAQHMLSVPAYYEDPAAIALYGYNLSSVTGVGITTEGQALRKAKWIVDTSINNTGTISFDVGFANAGMEPGDVIKVMDTDLAEVMNEALVVSYTGTSITFDRELQVTAGNTMEILGSDGVTLYTITLTNTGTSKTFNYSGGPISVSKGAVALLTGTIAPKPYKVVGVSEKSDGVWTISGLEYDANKFGRVDNTPTGPTPVYQQAGSTEHMLPVYGIEFAEESHIDVDGKAVRSLGVSWSRPAGQVGWYEGYWSKDDGTAISFGKLKTTSASIPVDSDGTFSVTIFAVNFLGTKSPPVTATHSVIVSDNVNPSSLLPVTDLQVVGGGLEFNTTVCSMEWTDPNGGIGNGYQVQVKDASTGAVYRTELVTLPKFTYSIVDQQVDNGDSVKRSFVISVKVKDTFGRFTTANAVTVSNPFPAAPTNAQAVGSYGGVYVSWDRPVITDYMGSLIWMSETPGFTVSQANLVGDVTGSGFTINGLLDGQTYYLRAAHYDTFGKNLDGSGMNLSGELSATTGSIDQDNADIEAAAAQAQADAAAAAQSAQDAADAAQGVADALVTTNQDLATAQGALINEVIVRSAQTGSLSTSLNTLTNKVEDPDTGLAVTADAVQGLQTAITDPTTGLSVSFTALKNTVEDPDTGLAVTADAVQTLKTTVGDESSGLVQAVTALNLTVTDPVTGNTANQAAIQSLTNTVGDSGSGLVEAVTSLTNTVNDPDGLIQSNATAIQGLTLTVGDSGSGLVQDVTSLKLTVNNPSSGVAANFSALSTLSGTVGDSGSGLVQDVTNLKLTVNNPTTGLAVTADAVQSLKTTVGDDNSGLVQSVTSLTSRLDNPTNGLVANANAISTLSTHVDDNYNSQAQSINTLSGTVNNGSTGVVATYNLTNSMAGVVNNSLNGVSALAQVISSFGTTVNGRIATVNSMQSSINGVMAKASVTTDVNGYVTGWALNNNGSSGSMTIRADRFVISSPTGGARTEFSNGNWRVYDGNGVLRVQMGVW